MMKEPKQILAERVKISSDLSKARKQIFELERSLMYLQRKCPHPQENTVSRGHPLYYGCTICGAEQIRIENE